MSVVTIKDKFQIEIPPGIRKKVKVEVGDRLEAKIEDGKIALTPKSQIDAHLVEALNDLCHGRTHGPYGSTEEAIRSLDARVDLQAVQVKVRDVIRMIEDDGWRFHSQRGSHRQYKHPIKAGRVTVAGKPGDDMHLKTLSDVFKQAQISKPVR